MGLSVTDLSPNIVRAFIYTLRKAGLAPATITSYILSLSTYFARKGRPTRSFRAQLAQDCLHALPHKHWVMPKELPYFKREDVLAIQEQLRGRHNEHVIAFAVSLAFYGLLRMSNLAALNAYTADKRHLCLGDVHDCRNGLYITLRWSKPSQIATRPTKIFVPCNGESDSVVLWWRKYIAFVSHRSTSAPLLQWPKGTIVTQCALRNNIRRLLVATNNAHPGHFHGFRHGGGAVLLPPRIPDGHDTAPGSMVVRRHLLLLARLTSHSSDVMSP